MTPPVQILVLATTNPGKTAELRALLTPRLDVARFRLVTPGDLGVLVPAVEENGTTFAENARCKAVAYADATGYPALADDSGLCVDALGGAPGLHSARWAGPEASDQDRTTLLLQRLRDIPADARTARFVCAASVAEPDGRIFTAQGVCQGLIAITPRGTHGFGYDPIFVLPDHGGRTMAELTVSEKNSVSHRARALAALMPQLSGQLLPPP